MDLVFEISLTDEQMRDKTANVMDDKKSINC